MSPISEIDAIAALDGTLAQLDDPMVRDRVLRWAWDKFISKDTPRSQERLKTEKSDQRRKRGKTITKSGGKSKVRFTLIKDLNLNPDGKASFKTFVEEKKPTNHQEKCMVALYYLSSILNVDGISANHIFTCYRAIHWRVADLSNVLSIAASRKGWANTSDKNSLKITSFGEDFVEHDLPRKAMGK